MPFESKATLVNNEHYSLPQTPIVGLTPTLNLRASCHVNQAGKVPWGSYSVKKEIVVLCGLGGWGEIQ